MIGASKSGVERHSGGRLLSNEYKGPENWQWAVNRRSGLGEFDVTKVLPGFTTNYTFRRNVRWVSSLSG